MKKLFTILFLLSAFISNAQRTMFGGNNNYVAPPPPPFVAPPITTGEVTNGLLLYLNAGNTSSYSGSGTTWYDLSGNGNHGTLRANGSGSLPVFQNGSFYFNGSSSYVSIVSSVIPNSGSFTVSTWAKMSSGRYTEMINTRNASSVTGFLLTSDGNNIRAQINNPSVNQFVYSGTHSTIQDDTWHLITITVDVSTRSMKAYVDNIFINSQTFSAGSLVGQQYFSIGWDYAWNGAPFYLGYIATVSVYDYALSNAEVITNYNATKSSFGYGGSGGSIVSNGLIQNLDASNQTSYPGSGSTWYDIVGSNNGAITGGTYSNALGVTYFNFNTKTANCYVSAPLTKTTSMTFNVWAKVSSVTQYSCMLFNAGPVGSGPDLFFYNSKIFWNTWDSESSPFVNSNNTNVSTVTMIPNVNWHNYTVVVDAAANNTKLYFDGALMGTAPYWSPTRSSPTDLIIGGAGLNDFGWNWLGGIASFQSYNRALTASEVTTNFNALKTRFGL